VSAAPTRTPAEPPPDGAGRADRVAFQLYGWHLFTLFGIALSNVVAGLMVLATPWALRHRRRLAPPPAAWPLLAALALYTLLLFAAIAASSEPRTSLRAGGEVVTLLTLLLGLYLVRGERQVRWVVDGLGIVAGLVAAAGLLQFFVGYGAIDRRIRGPFSHWMTFSGFLLQCDLLLIARLVAGPRPGPPPAGAPLWRRALTRWRWAALAAINLALLGSLTRSAWVAVVAALVLLALLRAPRLLLAFAPAVVVFALLAPVQVLARAVSIVDLRDPSNYDRLCMTEAGLRMVAERPLFGIGPGQVKLRYALYRPPSGHRYWVPHLHDTFLELAAERGLPALAAYLAMMAASVSAAWRGFVREGRFAGPRADLYLGALLALIALNVAGLFENNWGDTEVQRLALFVLAIPFCLAPAETAPAP
jgi:O-antigen ligase